MVVIRYIPELRALEALGCTRVPCKYGAGLDPEGTVQVHQPEGPFRLPTWN